MGNRYTGVNFTKRQNETVEGCLYKMNKIYSDLVDKDNLSSAAEKKLTRLAGIIYHMQQFLKT